MAKRLMELQRWDLQFLNDSQDIEWVKKELRVRGIVTGALITIEDGEVVEAWVTDSQRPYDLTVWYRKIRLRRREMKRSEIEVSVTLVASSPFELTQKRAKRITENIQRALKAEVDSGEGLMPEDTQEYTRSIVVCVKGEDNG